MFCFVPWILPMLVHSFISSFFLLLSICFDCCFNFFIVCFIFRAVVLSRARSLSHSLFCPLARYLSFVHCVYKNTYVRVILVRHIHIDRRRRVRAPHMKSRSPCTASAHVHLAFHSGAHTFLRFGVAGLQCYWASAKRLIQRVNTDSDGGRSTVMRSQTCQFDCASRIWVHIFGSRLCERIKEKEKRKFICCYMLCTWVSRARIDIIVTKKTHLPYS